LKDSEVDMEDISIKLKGNTLRVYWYLLRSSSGVVGVREVQRSLGFSSPTLALYHLEKLRELGLVKKELGEYRLVKEVKVDVLRQFMKFGTLIIPRYTLYAVMFTVLLCYYALELEEVSFHSVYGLIIGALATGILWYETIRVWLQRP